MSEPSNAVTFSSTLAAILQDIRSLVNLSTLQEEYRYTALRNQLVYRIRKQLSVLSIEEAKAREATSLNTERVNRIQTMVEEIYNHLIKNDEEKMEDDVTAITKNITGIILLRTIKENLELSIGNHVEESASHNPQIMSTEQSGNATSNNQNSASENVSGIVNEPGDMKRKIAKLQKQLKGYTSSVNTAEFQLVKMMSKTQGLPSIVCIMFEFLRTSLTIIYREVAVSSTQSFPKGLNHHYLEKKVSEGQEQRNV